MFRRTTPKRRWLIAVAAAACAVAAISAVAASGASSTTVASFNLAPNPKFIKCLAQYPNDPSRPPSAHVDVVKGNLNDRLTLHLHNIKPNLAFDLFTVQRSSLDDIAGGDAAENAALIREVLAGKKSPRRDVVLLNAAAALVAAARADHIREALPDAIRALDSGAARSKLEQLVEFTNR